MGRREYKMFEDRQMGMRFFVLESYGEDIVFKFVFISFVQLKGYWVRVITGLDNVGGFF